MPEKNIQNWSINCGDYQPRHEDYGKLYQKGKKRDKFLRALIWMGAAFVAYIVFIKVLAYAAWR